MQNQTKREITFDAQLKTALSEVCFSLAVAHLALWVRSV